MLGDLLLFVEDTTGGRAKVFELLDLADLGCLNNLVALPSGRGT